MKKGNRTAVKGLSLPYINTKAGAMGKWLVSRNLEEPTPRAERKPKRSESKLGVVYHNGSKVTTSQTHSNVRHSGYSREKVQVREHLVKTCMSQTVITQERCETQLEHVQAARLMPSASEPARTARAIASARQLHARERQVTSALRRGAELGISLDFPGTNTTSSPTTHRKSARGSNNNSENRPKHKLDYQGDACQIRNDSVTGRIFFACLEDEVEGGRAAGSGEEADWEDSEVETICESVTMEKHLWRHRPTGRKGLDRFRKLVEFVMMVRRLFEGHAGPQLSAQESILFFLDIPSYNLQLTQPPPDPHSQNKLNFDLASYKGIKERTVISGMRATLDVCPRVRTEEQVMSLVHTMRTFGSFAAYPHHIQTGICHRAWYSSFEQTRMLVRQGGRAEVFYFILSGVAISRSVEVEGPRSRQNRRRQQATFLRKGDTIGEREILEDCSRDATVICKEPLEVLGLDRQDFLDIFRTVMGDNLDNLPFLRTVDELEDFPLHLLRTRQFACSAHSYRRGAVITADSNESEWIYVIKSGSCQVFKSIRALGKDQKCGQWSGSEDSADSGLALPATVFPDIHAKLGPDDRKHRRKNPMRRRSISDSYLPRLKPGSYNLVSRPIENPGANPDATLGGGTRRSRLRSRKPSSRSPESPRQLQRYAHLQHLIPGEIFGLQSLLYEGTPNLTLLSNGAECVLISKTFLRDHLTTAITHKLRKQVAPYPNMPSLQAALEHQVHWDSYKQEVVRDTIN